MREYRRVNTAWGKVELFLGLGAMGLAVLLDKRVFPEFSWGVFAGRWLLFVLGGYLTLAGHRNHLYRSLNEQTEMLRNDPEREETRDETSG